MQDLQVRRLEKRLPVRGDERTICPEPVEPDSRKAQRRPAGDDAVEVPWKLLGQPHRLHAAGRAAHEVGLAGIPAIVSPHDALARQRRDVARSGEVFDRSLWIAMSPLHRFRGLRLVATVRNDTGISASQRRITATYMSQCAAEA